MCWAAMLVASGKVLATRLALQKAALGRVFASMVFLVALYMLYRSTSAIPYEPERS